LRRERLLATLAQRGHQLVSYAGWNAMNRHELGLGEAQGRPRVEFVRRDDLLVCAQAAATGIPREE
jgi:ferredoxin/flavodoxin---NADP+ reductase